MRHDRQNWKRRLIVAMFSYLRSHHKRSSQPSSPISATPSECRPTSRIDYTSFSHFSDSEVDKSLQPKRSVQDTPASQHSGHNEGKVRQIGHPQYQYVGPDQRSTQGAIHEAQSIALIRSSPSLENLRPATSSQSRADRLPLDSKSRPSTSYTLPSNRIVAHSNTDGQMNSQTPLERLKEGSEVAHSSSSSQPVKSTRTKLNLFKPITLLARRKSGQPDEHFPEENLACHKTFSVPAINFPDDYDPSIRGKVIHDFSAPRPKRGLPSTTVGTKASEIVVDISHGASKNVKRTGRFSNPRNSDRLHTPVFIEHFDDDGSKAEEYQAAVQAERLADKEFISRNMPSPRNMSAKPTFEVGMLRGAFPARIDSLKPRSGAALKLFETLETSPSVSPPYDETSDASNSETEDMTSSERHNSSTDQSTNIPSRWTSKASRFSFQTGGSDSAAQERLLEERHKQKAAAQDSKNPGIAVAQLDENENSDEAYDDMYDETDYLEEQIPGVNADLNDDDEILNSNLASAGVAEMSLDSLCRAKSLEDVPIRSEAEQDTQNNVKATKEPSLNLGEDLDELAEPGENDLNINIKDLRVKQAKTTAVGVATKLDTVETGIGQRIDTRKRAENDDLYFDDGAIEDINEPEEISFNESLLDNFDQAMPGRSVENIDANDSANDCFNRSAQLLDDSPCSKAVLPPRISSLQLNTNNSGTYDLTINAYHSALADAANKAVADGKFKRRDSFNATDDYDTGTYQETSSDTSDNSKRELLFDDPDGPVGENDYGVNMELDSYNPNIAHYDGYAGAEYDYDNYVDEDDIVAEANAEALANDDDGFYGQEFGFYSHALGNGSEEEQAANGGFFGPRGLDGLGRSASGRNAVREPNLTPITERSEYSARSSYITLLNAGIGAINLAGSGHLAASVATAPSSAAHSSPNLSLTQSVHPYGFEQDDMTMSQLLRLRRGAFGGSSTSLKSGDTSGSSSGLGSVNGGPAINASHLSATAEVSSLSPSNSGSSASSKLDSFQPDSQHQVMPGINVAAAAMHAMVSGTRELTNLAVDSNTCEPDQHLQNESQRDRNNLYNYEDDDNSLPASPTLTATTYPDPKAHTTNGTGLSLVTTSPTLPSSLFSSHPQLQGQPDSHLPLMYQPTPVIPLTSSNNNPTDNPLDYHIIQSFSNPALNLSSIRTDEVSTQLMPSPTVTSPPLGSSCDWTLQRSPTNSKPLFEKGTNTGKRRKDENQTDEHVTKPFVKSHRRNGGSSTDSISVAYVRERDADGADKWVLERRRTAEDGRMELVGREFISEGRI